MFMLVNEGGFGRALHVGDIHAAKARTPRAGGFTASAGWPLSRQALLSLGWLRQAGIPDM